MVKRYFVKCPFLHHYSEGTLIVNEILTYTGIDIEQILFSSETLIEPQHEISNNVVCATSKGSDKPAHTPFGSGLLLVA